MTGIVLCPNCGGQKTISKPPYIAGDVNAWVSSGTPMYPCPTCDGHGWIRVDSVSQDDFDNVKFVALSSMETAENLMDECTKRADKINELETRTQIAEEHADTVATVSACTRRDFNIKIKELETELECMVAGERAADKEIERLRVKIFDIEGREDLVTTELEHRSSVAEGRLRVVKEMRDELLEDWEAKRATVIRDEADLELLEDILKIVNPLIKSGAYAKPSAEGRLLAIRMHGLCQTVVQFRRKHNIVE